MSRTPQRLPNELLDQLGLTEHCGILLPKVRKQTTATCPVCDAWAPPCFVFPKNLFNLLTLVPGEHEVMLGHFCPSKNILFNDHHREHVHEIPEKRTIQIERTTENDFRAQISNWPCPACNQEHTKQILDALRNMGYVIRPDLTPPNLSFQF